MLQAMKKKISAALSIVLARKIELLIGGTYTFLIAEMVMGRAKLAKFVPQPADQWAVTTTFAALAGISIALFSFFWFIPSLIFDEKTNTYIDIKTGKHFCVSCKHSQNKKVPLGEIRNGWKCACCKKYFPNPSLQNQKYASYEPLDPGVGY